MSRSRHDRGAAAVEFALVLPVLLVLVLGIVEFGRAYNVQTTLSLAAREGVRAMALTNDATTAKAKAVAAGSTISLTTGQVAVSYSSGTTCVVAAGLTPPDVTVTITYPMSYLTSFFGTSITLKGKAVMRCNG